MKKRDILLAMGVLAVSAVMLLIMHFTGKENGSFIRITIDGNVYGTYSLDKDQVIDINNNDNHNLINIHEGSAYMQEADCPDGYCKRQGKISGKNQTIVCLPHKLVVEVINEDDSKINDKKSDSESDGALPDTIAK